MKADWVEGKGSTAQPVPDVICTGCDHAGSVRYLGTDVLEGSLKLYYAVHTEVEHHLHCERCDHHWTWFRML